MPPLTLALVGDVLLGRGVAPLKHSPQTSLARFAPLVAGADLAFANLEAAPRSGRTGRKPFYLPGDLALLRDAGFDGLSLANNHSLDSGEDGARSTQLELKWLGLKGAGLGLNREPTIPIWDVNGRRVALVAATQWGPFVRGNARLQTRDLPFLKQRIQQLNAQDVFVIASLHWGIEGVATISSEQKQLAREFIEAGAVAVWGHHPHVAGMVETFQGRPIFASTGNFLWDTMKAPQSGILARLEINGQTPSQARVRWRAFPVNPEARALSSPPTPRGETLKLALPGRFDGELGSVSWIVWTQKAKRPLLRAMQKTDGGWRVRAMGFPRDVRSIKVGDLNSDGRDDVIVELRQRSKLDAGIKPRLHVYGVERDRFKPLWRGSQLSRPFSSWALLRRSDDLGCDLAALERDVSPGSMWLTLYRWNGFGVRVVWQQKFAGRLGNLRSGCDFKGTWLRFECIQNERRRTLQARRVSGELLAVGS